MPSWPEFCQQRQSSRQSHQLLMTHRPLYLPKSSGHTPSPEAGATTTNVPVFQIRLSRAMICSRDHINQDLAWRPSNTDGNHTQYQDMETSPGS